MRLLVAHASWVIAILAAAVLLRGGGRIAADDVAGFVQAGVWAVGLAAVGVVVALAGLVVTLRPPGPALVGPLVGLLANGLLLWWFARPVLGLAF
jgi:hypothetical protein